MMKKIHVMTTIFLLAGATLFGQSFSKEIQFDGKKGTKEYSMKVSEGLKSMSFVLKSKITRGYIYIELFDTEKNIMGRFAVFFKNKAHELGPPKKIKKGKHDLYKVIKANENLKYNKGELQKIINNPSGGNWTIKVKSDTAVGTVLIENIVKKAL